jgi:hypothetical protein
MTLRKANSANTEHKSTVKVAWIGAVGVVMAAIIAGVSTNFLGKRPELKTETTPAPASTPSPTPENPLRYNGRVIDADTGAGMEGAQVLIEVDQNQPEPHVTDSFGYFYLNVPKDARSFRVRVSAAGYRPFDSGVTPVRTGTHDIVLVKAHGRLKNPSDEGAFPSKPGNSVAGPPTSNVTPTPPAPAREEVPAGSHAVRPPTDDSEALSKTREELLSAIKNYNDKYGTLDLRQGTLNCRDYNGAMSALRTIKYLADRVGDHAAEEFVMKTSPGPSFRWGEEPCKK